MSALKPGTRVRGLKRAEVDLGFTWGPLNTILMGFGVAVLVGGFVGLSSGSTNRAVGLLVLGYCGLIPASLSVRGLNGDSGESLSW